MARYGDFMRQFDVSALPLPEDQRNDPLMMRFVYLADVTARAEKISSPDDWSIKERVAYAKGDTVEFSRLRGYTEQEISEFLEFCDLAAQIDARYGENYACEIDHLIHVHAWPCPTDEAGVNRLAAPNAIELATASCDPADVFDWYPVSPDGNQAENNDQTLISRIAN